MIGHCAALFVENLVMEQADAGEGLTLNEARAERHKNMRTAQQHQHGQPGCARVDAPAGATGTRYYRSC